MSPERVLIPALVAFFVSSCAATSGPASPAVETLRSFESLATPRVVPGSFESPKSKDSPDSGAAPEMRTFSLEAELAALPAPTLAQGSGGGEPKSPHSFAGGLGIRVRNGDSALDINVQYHYYVNEKLDIGAIADWALSPIDTLLVAPAAWFSPNDRLTVFGAPGFEWASRGGIEPALRVGGSYRLMLEKLAIRPFGWYDFVKDRSGSFALGVSFGF